MPCVSILVPCYNAEKTIKACLQSLKGQTLEDFEVILVDDVSTDSAKAILRNWAARDARYKPIALSHRGIIHALNAGLSNCTAPYVARMDADADCYPKHLAKQVAYL